MENRKKGIAKEEKNRKRRSFNVIEERSRKDGEREREQKGEIIKNGEDIKWFNGKED